MEDNKIMPVKSYKARVLLKWTVPIPSTYQVLVPLGYFCMTILGVPLRKKKKS